MSRSGYVDDSDQWDLIRWRGAVKSAIRGQRGQALLSDALTALDAMPKKRLIARELVSSDGDFCALGVVGAMRNLDVADLDPEDAERIADAFNIAPALAREIVYVNDDAGFYDETPEIRWDRVRRWVESQVDTQEECSQ